MSETTLRRTLPEAYTIGLVGADDYWGFLEGGAGVICAAYADGTYVEDVAETGDLPNGLQGVRAVLVAERYLIVADHDGAYLAVWDVVGNSVATYNAPVGKFIFGAGAVDGTVYWIEWPNGAWSGGPVPYTSTVQLRSAGYDLATPADEGSVTISENFQWEWRNTSSPYWFALNELAAMAAWIAWDVVNNEVSEVFRVRLPLSGAEGTYAAGANDVALFALGVPEPAGGSFLPGNFDDGALLELEDAVSVTNQPTARWPTSSPWLLGYVANVAVSPDQADAIAYDYGGELLRAAVDAASGEPDKSFTVDAHPVELVPPYLMFPRSA